MLSQTTGPDSHAGQMFSIALNREYPVVLTACFRSGVCAGGFDKAPCIASVCTVSNGIQIRTSPSSHTLLCPQWLPLGRQLDLQYHTVPNNLALIAVTAGAKRLTMHVIEPA